MRTFPAGSTLPCARVEVSQPAASGTRSARRVHDLYERERLLIVHDLHDGLAQHLSAAMLYLEVSRQSWATNRQASEASWKKGMDLLVYGITELRRLMNGLQPAILDHCGVVGAVDELVDTLRSDFGLEVDFHHDVKFDRLFPLLETSLFCIIQESLENARRHSESKRICVTMKQRGHRIWAEIRDWGVGFNPAKVDQTRFGVRGIEKRAKLFGGRATIQSAIGQGTRIIVDIPIVESPLI